MLDSCRKGGRSLRPSAWRFSAILVTAAALLACRTPPPPPAVHPSLALPAGKDAYFTVSVPENRDFLRRTADDIGLRSRGTDYFIERARVIYGAADIPAGGGLSFILAAEGDYSRALVEFGVRREEGWEEVILRLERGRLRYYREAATGIEIAVPSSRLILIGSGDMEQSLLSLYGRASVPEAPAKTPLPAFHDRHTAALHLPRPDKNIMSRLGTAGMILDDILLYADRVDASYAVSGSLEFREEREARAVSVLLRLLLSGLLVRQGRSFSQIRAELKIAVTGGTLSFEGAVFPEAAVAEALRAALPAAGDAR